MTRTPNDIPYRMPFTQGPNALGIDNALYRAPGLKQSDRYQIGPDGKLITLPDIAPRGPLRWEDPMWNNRPIPRPKPSRKDRLINGLKGG